MKQYNKASMHILITYNRKVSVNNHFLGDHLLSTYVKFSEKKCFLPFDTHTYDYGGTY